MKGNSRKARPPHQPPERAKMLLNNFVMDKPNINPMIP